MSAGVMAELLFNPDNSDVQLVFNDGEKELAISAHGLVLKQRCEVFEKMLAKNSFKEGLTGKVFLGGVPTKVAHSFVRFLYLEEFPECSSSHLIDLMTAGNMYYLESLVNYCDEKLVTKINLDNVFDVFRELLQLESIFPRNSVTVCLDLMSRAFEVIVHTGMHLDMTQKEFLKLLSLEHLNVSGKLICVKALADWARRRSQENRLQVSNERLIEPFKDCIEWSKIKIEELQSFGDFSNVLVKMKRDCETSVTLVRERQVLSSLKGFNYRVLECLGSDFSECPDSDFISYRRKLFIPCSVYNKYHMLSLFISKSICLLGLEIKLCDRIIETTHAVIKSNNIRLQSVRISPKEANCILPTHVVLQSGDKVDVKLSGFFEICKSNLEPVVSRQVSSGVDFIICNVAGFSLDLFFIPL